MEKLITLRVNGRSRQVTTDPERPLLEVLREDLQLTGTKYGCGEGRCGACTVVLDGQSTHSCITPISKADGLEVLTIEGLAKGDSLHPVQEAFLAEGASQCGYCTPGMVMAVIGLLQQRPNATADDILSHMEGNVCRCCNYPRLAKALRRCVTVNGRPQP